MQNVIIYYLTDWLAVWLLGNSDVEIGVACPEFRPPMSQHTFRAKSSLILFPGLWNTIFDQKYQIFLFTNF